MWNVLLKVPQNHEKTEGIVELSVQYPDYFPQYCFKMNGFVEWMAVDAGKVPQNNFKNDQIVEKVL